MEFKTIENCIEEWDHSELEIRYKILINIFKEENNLTNISKKVTTLDTFYLTRIQNNYWKIIKAIHDIFEQDKELLKNIKDIKENDYDEIKECFDFFLKRLEDKTRKNYYSFSSKYLHFSNPNFFIFDSKARFTLSTITIENKLENKFKNRYRDYDGFVNAIKECKDKNIYNFKDKTAKEIDHFLYLNGYR